MPSGWGFAALLTCWLLQLLPIGASPNLDFPINAQVPPVAQTSNPYLFVFSASTFASVDGPISYALSDEPTWLQLDSGTRTFSGTPGPKDAGAITFNLIANDNVGSTSASVTFVILSTSNLEVVQPILPQLAKAGSTSSPASLLLLPLQDFTFSFEAGTFTNTNVDTEFYAVSANNTPLPNWVQFDSSSLGFSGTSPPLVSSTAAPQVYGIKLIASSVAGFSEATINFQLVVGYHILTADDEDETINISPGEEFSSIEFRNGLKQDGNPLRDSDSISVTFNGPDWVHLDTTTISISGTPPADVRSTNATITILDGYGDTLNITVELIAELSTISLFTGPIPDANATAGDSFSYTINANLLSSKDIQLSADLDGAAAWLRFSQQNRTFHGRVPGTTPVGPQKIVLTATEHSSSESRSFIIQIASLGHASSSSATKTPSTTKSDSNAVATTSTASTPPFLGRQQMPTSNMIRIILATILPALLIILIICLILCWRRKHAYQRERRQSVSQDGTPRPDESRHNPIAEAAEVSLVPKPPETSRRRSPPSRPPQVDLPWAPDSMRISKIRMSKRLRPLPAALGESTWDDLIIAETASATSPHLESTRAVNAAEDTSQDEVPSLREVTPISSRKKSARSAQSSRPISVSKRTSQRHSTASVASPGIPQRMSGAGHGAGGTPPPVFRGARSSWQTTMGTLAGLDSKRSTVVLNDFPSPPRQTGGSDIATVLQARSPNRPQRLTLRMVRSDSTRSADLQKWYTDRARDRLEGRARFSSASSRPVSNPRLLWEHDSGSIGTSTAHLSEIENSIRPTDQGLSGNARGRQRGSMRRLVGPSSYMRTPSRLRRDVSTASSGQFDSAISADSWEDENLIEGEVRGSSMQLESHGAGHHFHRLPSEAETATPGGMPSPAVSPSRWRLGDIENPVSNAGRQTKRPEERWQDDSAFV